METLEVSDIISTCSTFIKEAIQEYAEKQNISSIPADHWCILTQHVLIYCLEKTAASLLKSPESDIREEKTQTIMEEERHGEVEKNVELEQLLQSSADPSKSPESDIREEKTQTIVEEERHGDVEKNVELEQLLQSSADPSKIIVGVTSLMQLMTEHHKQQQEFQEKTYRTLQDQLSHQHRQQEQRQQQQNKVFEQFLQQQQDFQSRLMADFIKHTEMQATLFCQALTNGKKEQPVQDDNVNMNREPEERAFFIPCSMPDRTFIPEDTARYKPPSPETTYLSNTGHHYEFGQGSAEKSGSFSHYEVTNRGKQSFPVFDCRELGQRFCLWFYSQLNAQNPSHGQEKPHWGPDIFWKDAIFSIVHDNSIDKYTGDECVSSKLLEMTQDQKLTFTPMPDGKRLNCVNSKHGLVVVAVTGVITNSDNCSGVFNQIFGLIRCPSTGIYRIKSIYLRMDNWDPLISGHNMHVPPLQYTTEELQDYK